MYTSGRLPIPTISCCLGSNAFKTLDQIITDIWGENHGFKFVGPDPHSATVRNGTKYDFVYMQEFYEQTCEILEFGDYHVYLDLKLCVF